MYRISIVSIIVGLFLFACATDNPNQLTETGAVLGSLGGGAVGQQLDDDSGKKIGEAIGTIAGARSWIEPTGLCHFMMPLLISIALNRPHGGLVHGTSSGELSMARRIP